MSGNRHMKSTLHPLVDTLGKTVFSLKGNDGSEFITNHPVHYLHMKMPSTVSFKSGLRSLAEPIISASYYSSLQQKM